MALDPSKFGNEDDDQNVTITFLRVTGKASVVVEVAKRLEKLLIDINGVVVKPQEGRGAGD